jgi:hypothetical protein
MTDLSSPELFLITASEISIELGAAPTAAELSTLSAWWFDDHCVGLDPNPREDERAERPFEITVDLAGEISPDARKALAEYIDQSEISLAVIGGDETIDPPTRLKSVTAASEAP